MVQPQLLREARAAGHGLVLRPAAPRQHPLPRGLGTGPGLDEAKKGALVEVLAKLSYNLIYRFMYIYIYIHIYIYYIYIHGI